MTTWIQLLPATLLFIGISLGKIDNNEKEMELNSSISNLTIQFLKLMPEFAVENTAFSPFSVGLQLGVLQQGAGDSTKDEIGKLLGFTPATSQKHFRELLKYLEDYTENVMHWGNRIYLRNDFEIEAAFRENIESNFNTSVESIDFKTKDAVEVINDWVSMVTAKNIEQAIDQDSFKLGSVMLLVSAIYFSDDWENQFKTRDTENLLFHLDENSAIKIPFMIQKNFNTNIGADTELGATWIHLDYSKASTLAMLLVKPTERFGLIKLLGRLKESDLLRMMDHETKNFTTILIPKFGISGNMLLPTYLKELGVTKIFMDESDLSGIAKSNLVHVTNMIHECRIEVNEEGTTAAAVATATFQFLSGSLKYTDNSVFKADEPFLFFIYDKNLKLILFAGKVSNPQTSSATDEGS